MEAWAEEGRPAMVEQVRSDAWLKKSSLTGY
jgi:hypothetical protein